MASVRFRKHLAPVLSALCLAGSVWAGSEQATFTVTGFQVEGNTLLPQQQVEAAVSPHKGPDKTFADVQLALEALQLSYRKAGYGVVMVSVPEQEVRDGVVRLRVTEPRLKKVAIQYDQALGRDWFSEENIRASLPNLPVGGLVHTPAVSRDVLLANENPAKHIEVVLRSEEAPGDLSAGVKVHAANPRKAFLTLDNTGTNTSGEYRVGVGFQHANLFGKDHVATLSYATPVDRPTEVNLYSASYRLPFYRWGDSMDFIVAKSDVGNVSTGTVAGALQFAGSGNIYGLRYNLLLPRIGEYAHRIVGGLDYREFKNSCTLGSFGSAGCGPSAASITIAPASLSYVGQWTTSANLVDFYLTGSHNIPGADSGSQRDFDRVRPDNRGTGGARTDYRILRTGISYLRLLDGDWKIRLGGNAQYSPDALVFAEQFGLAGSMAVRGFWEREVTRDMGYVVNVEGYTPNVAARLGLADELRGLAFFDYGVGRNRPLPGEQAQDIALTSVGVGLRLGYRQSLQLRFDGAYVLDGATSHRAGDARSHLSVYLPFAF